VRRAPAGKPGVRPAAKPAVRRASPAAKPAAHRAPAAGQTRNGLTAGRGRRLAELFGGTLADDGSAATVTFPGAASAANGAAANGIAASGATSSAVAPTPPTAPVLARSALAGASPPLSTAPRHAQPGNTGLDLDEVYEHVAARLRRELMNDRERVGDLLGDLPGSHPPR
jgi:hypothetical protein